MVKEQIINIASKNPEKVYPIAALNERGFKRKQCKICKRYFWSIENRETCADHEPYSFIGKPIKPIEYKKLWDLTKKFFSERGYVPLNSYPVVARWRDDLDFVIASIVDFQPHIVNGEIEPIANRIIIPQYCLRFDDLPLVGYSGRHFTSFIMIGQHAFEKPENYNPYKYLRDLLDYFNYLGFKDNQLVIHEDAWAGGGNAGPSLEIFYTGLELANQVYMVYKVIDNKLIPMENIRVLDMGAGHERIVWALNGSINAYEVTFPNSLKYLRNYFDLDREIKDIYYLGYKIESKDDIINVAKEYAENFGFDLDYVLKAWEEYAKMYIVADHLRSVYLAIKDGMLPSNTGGGYNIRILLRRVFKIMEEKGFEIEKVIELIQKDLL